MNTRKIKRSSRSNTKMHRPNIPSVECRLQRKPTITFLVNYDGIYWQCVTCRVASFVTTFVDVNVLSSATLSYRCSGSCLALSQSK